MLVIPSRDKLGERQGTVDERIARFRLRDISPHTFANETCSALLAQAEALIKDLHPYARVTKHAAAQVRETRLWQRVFTWVEYAQTGHKETPALLRDAPPAWDDRMIAVIRAVEARKSLDDGECVSTAQLALLAGISHIQIGNFVRAKKLLSSSQDSSGYLFAPDAARAFLIDREVPGLAATQRRKRVAS